MRFSTLATLAAVTISTVVADLHYNAICVDTANGNEYDSKATEQACTWYRNRNTGTKQWDTCPDCQMITSNGNPVCNSAAKHIGGDEITYYCKLAGAGNALT